MVAMKLSRKLTRRAALGSAGLLALSVLAMQGAPARPRASPGGIYVDVTPLAENSGEPTAGWVAREMPAALTETGVAGPVSVRVDEVLLGPSSGGAQVAGASLDQIVGEATVGGVARPIRASVNYYPSAVDQPQFEQSNHIRVSQLVQAFAFWVAKEG